jgi:hypothetical protein
MNEPKALKQTELNHKSVENLETTMAKQTNSNKSSSVKIDGKVRNKLINQIMLTIQAKLMVKYRYLFFSVSNLKINGNISFDLKINSYSAAELKTTGYSASD